MIWETSRLDLHMYKQNNTRLHRIVSEALVHDLHTKVTYLTNNV